MSDREDYIDEECYVITADVYGLSGAEWLAELPLGKIRAAYNGIGPEWLPAQIREKLNKHLGLFSVCAVVHDCRFAYDNDGSSAKFNAANDELERNCRIVADATYSWWQLRRYIARRAGRIIADACRDFGWTAWRDAYEVFRSSDRDAGGEGKQSLSG